MWQATIPFEPVSAPRPRFRGNIEGDDDTKWRSEHLRPYYPKKYIEYLSNVKNFLIDNSKIDDEFHNIVNDDMGVILEVEFHCSLPKNYTKLHNIFKTRAPDLDNYLKAVMDAIFNASSVNDSKVVGVIAWKYNTVKKPRTEVRIKKVSEFDFKKINSKHEYSWKAEFKFKPMPTPRPKSKTTKKSVITYYSKEYNDYLKRIKETLIEENLINDNLVSTMKSKYGVIAEIDYFYPVRKDTKSIKNIMKTTIPDLDNLIKATLDGIFTKDMPVRDSRVVGIIAFKYNVEGNPRTEVRLRSVE